MIRLGIVGLGKRLASVLAHLQAAAPDLVVAGVVDPDPRAVRERLPAARAAELRFFDTVEELLRAGKPDALAIGTRCDLHARHALSVAETGLPLFLEKPVATNLADAQARARAYARSDDKVVVSFPLRASPLCGMAKARLERGAVGRLEHILAVNYVPYGDVYFDSWYRDTTITGGLFLQKATHDFDYLAHLAGAPIVRVAAMAQHGRVFRDKSLEPAAGDSTRSYHEHVGTPGTGMNEDASSTLLEFANGVHGVYTQVFYTRHHGAARGATLSGLGGTLRFDWYRNELRLHRHDAPLTEIERPDTGHDHFGGDAVLAANFIDVVRGKARSRSPLSAGLASLHACLAARESAATGRFVEVPRLAAPAPLAEMAAC